MAAQLSGVLSALVTPFAADGGIDEGTLRRVVDRTIDGGVDGVVACGSTGEFAALSAAEPIELSRHAAAAGASVLMLVTPYYEPLTLEETLRYLRRVAGAVDVPIMLYNLPGATGVNLSPATVGQLAREGDNIRYVKDTSADLA